MEQSVDWVRIGETSEAGKNVNMYFLGLFLRPLGKELQPKYCF